MVGLPAFSDCKLNEVLGGGTEVFCFFGFRGSRLLRLWPFAIPESPLITIRVTLKNRLINFLNTELHYHTFLAGFIIADPVLRRTVFCW